MNINNENNYMTIDNLRELLKIYKNYVNHTHNINIDNEKINLKKIIFTLMQKINSTKYAKTLKIDDLNKITLKNIRDHINENYKHLFPSKEQFAAIHRENQVHNNRNNRIEVDLRDRVNQNSNLFGKKTEIADNFKKTQTIRNFEVTKLDKVKKNLDFSEKNETILTKNDFTDRMNELQNNRDEFMRNSKKKNKDLQGDISELQPNVELQPNLPTINNDIQQNISQINNQELDSNANTMLMGKIDDTNQTNNLETNDLNLDGFDFSAFDDENMDTFASFDNNTDTQPVLQETKNEILSDQQELQQPIEQISISAQPIEQIAMSAQPQQPAMSSQPQQPAMSPQPQQTYINKQKLIINSIDRDKLLYPDSNKYTIEFKNPIQNIIKIKLVNVLINLNKIKDEQNYAILKLNDFQNVISNNKNIMNTFAILYSNKIYEEEIEFYTPLDSLDNFTIEINDMLGNLYKFNKSSEHIFEFLIEYI